MENKQEENKQEKNKEKKSVGVAVPKRVRRIKEMDETDRLLYITEYYLSQSQTDQIILQFYLNHLIICISFHTRITI